MPSMKCPKCNGRGYFETVSLWHTDVYDCRACHGTGKVAALKVEAR